MAKSTARMVAPKPAVRTADLFHDALAPELVLEGGKVDDPRDPGGRTNKGITQRVYNAWRTKSHLPIRDVYKIADNEVEAIYRVQYWQAVKGDALPAGVGFVVFDGAVNSGPKQSIKWLQRALGFEGSQVDGVIGQVTLAAVQDVDDHDVLIARIIDRRETFLRALKTFDRFGRGWLKRLAVVEETGQAWAAGSVGPEIVPIEDANAKADIKDAKVAPGRGFGDAATGGGIGAGGIGGVLQTAQEQLTPYSSAGGWIETLVVILIVAGIVLAAGGFAYRFWAKRRTEALEDALDKEGVR